MTYYLLNDDSVRCPRDIAWAGKAFNNTAHHLVECSGAGLCDRSTVNYNYNYNYNYNDIIPFLSLTFMETELFCRDNVNVLMDMKDMHVKEVKIKLLLRLFHFVVY